MLDFLYNLPENLATLLAVIAGGVLATFGARLSWSWQRRNSALEQRTEAYIDMYRAFSVAAAAHTRVLDRRAIEVRTSELLSRLDALKGAVEDPMSLADGIASEVASLLRRKYPINEMSKEEIAELSMEAVKEVEVALKGIVKTEKEKLLRATQVAQNMIESVGDMSTRDQKSMEAMHDSIYSSALRFRLLATPLMSYQYEKIMRTFSIANREAREDVDEETRIARLRAIQPVLIEFERRARREIQWERRWLLWRLLLKPYSLWIRALRK